jgi:hypothetical protein
MSPSVSSGIFSFFFMFLYLGLLLLFVFVLDSLVYGVGVCLAGKPLPLVSQEGCCVALQSFNILDVSSRMLEHGENVRACVYNDKGGSLISWPIGGTFPSRVIRMRARACLIQVITHVCDTARFSISSTSLFAVYDSVGSVTTEVSVKWIPRALRVTLPPPL